jgi:hypothetical protein
MRLWRYFESRNLTEDFSIMVATHISYGVDLLIDDTEDERIAKAELFVNAGNKAKLASSFRTAAHMFRCARHTSYPSLERPLPTFAQNLRGVRGN